MKDSKVIIIDDEPIICSGLENWLSRDYHILSFGSSASFLEAFNDIYFEKNMPTCILLDFQMPGMNGVELQTTLKKMNVKFPIIFMSGNAQQADIIDAWHGGAVDFVLKPFTPTQIANTLKNQFEKLKIKQLNIDDSKPNTNININIPITKREAQVLMLLGDGRQQIETAHILGISIRTVKMYRGFLKDKLGLNSLAELGRYYTENKQAIENISKK